MAPTGRATPGSKDPGVALLVFFFVLLTRKILSSREEVDRRIELTYVEFTTSGLGFEVSCGVQRGRSGL